jgi:hypothetical protein
VPCHVISRLLEKDPLYNSELGVLRFFMHSPPPSIRLRDYRLSLAPYAGERGLRYVWFPDRVGRFIFSREKRRVAVLTTRLHGTRAFNAINTSRTLERSFPSRSEYIFADGFGSLISCSHTSCRRHHCRKNNSTR